MRKVDYIIVGQGLAGTVLAHGLEATGKSIQFIDAAHEGASTIVAAGVINPITGRRYVKSWKIEELLPVATMTYRAIEQKLGASYYHPTNIIRTLENHGEELNWLLRTDEASYQPYMIEEADLGAYAERTVAAFSYGELKHSARVDVRQLVEDYRRYWQQRDALLTERFDYNALQIEENQVHYREITASKIIFCEGHQASENPFFSYLPFNKAKGEILLIKVPNANFQKIFKHKIFIVPQGDDLYWIGTTTEWKIEDDTPTQPARDYLIGRLEQCLTVPFELVDHRAAIRPTVRDRRPFIGLHSTHLAVGIFNGLGTKGASLAPFFAQQFIDFLLHDGALDPSVDIQRV